MNTQIPASQIEKGDSSVHEGQLDMVAFQMGQQVYALPVDTIYQIIDMVAITQIPEAKNTIEGIINYHGATVPVVDLRRFLNLPRLPVHLHTPMILAAFSGHILALIVDKVLDVVSYPQGSIFRPKDLLPEDLGKFSIIDGVIQSSENFILLLNLERLFSSQPKQDLAAALENLAVPAQELFETQKPADPFSISSSGNKLVQAGKESEKSAGEPEIVHKANQKGPKKPAASKPKINPGRENNPAIPQEGKA